MYAHMYVCNYVCIYNMYGLYAVDLASRPLPMLGDAGGGLVDRQWIALLASLIPYIQVIEVPPVTRRRI